MRIVIGLRDLKRGKPTENTVDFIKMASVKGLSAEQLQAKIDALKAQGKTESTSKELGKYIDALKVLTPQKYGAKTVESAKQKLAVSTTPETQQELGITPFGATTTPSSTGLGSGQPAGINLNKIYESALSDPALKSLETELTTKKKARDEAEADINDNPYYTEATRVGKIAKLDEKAGDELKTLQSQIDSKKADAQIKVNIATQQYNIDSNEYQKNLSKLNLLISSGAIVGASSSDVAQIALATGMSTDMVKSIIDTTKQGQIQTSVTTNTDDNGNVTVSVINTKTGEVVAQNSLGAIGNKQTGSSGVNFKPGSSYYTQAANAMTQDLSSVQGEDKYVDPVAFRTFRSQWVSAGFNPIDFDKTFAGFINPTHAQDYIYDAGKSGTVINLGD